MEELKELDAKINDLYAEKAEICYTIGKVEKQIEECKEKIAKSYIGKYVKCVNKHVNFNIYIHILNTKFRVSEWKLCGVGFTEEINNENEEIRLDSNTELNINLTEFIKDYNVTELTKDEFYQERKNILDKISKTEYE